MLIVTRNKARNNTGRDDTVAGMRESEEIQMLRNELREKSALFYQREQEVFQEVRRWHNPFGGVKEKQEHTRYYLDSDYTLQSLSKEIKSIESKLDIIDPERRRAEREREEREQIEQERKEAEQERKAADQERKKQEHNERKRIEQEIMDILQKSEEDEANRRAETKRKKQEVLDKLQRTYLNEAKKKQKQYDTWKSQGLCPHCGGKKGIFRTCRTCKVSYSTPVLLPKMPLGLRLPLPLKMQCDCCDYDYSFYAENNGTGTFHCFGFYADGTIIGVTARVDYSMDGFQRIVKWFNKSHQSISKGIYSISELTKELKFSSTSHAGTVDYWGKINSIGDLQLESQSHINNYRSGIILCEYIGAVKQGIIFFGA